MEISQLRRKEEEGGEDQVGLAKQWREGWQLWMLWATRWQVEMTVSMNIEGYMSNKVTIVFS